MRNSHACEPTDGPLDNLLYDKREQTGLLTRFFPERLKRGKFYRMLLCLLRVFQFTSAVVSLGIFS
jgi:hypothetical protein